MIMHAATVYSGRNFMQSIHLAQLMLFHLDISLWYSMLDKIIGMVFKKTNFVQYRSFPIILKNMHMSLLKTGSCHPAAEQWC